MGLSHYETTNRVILRHLIVFLIVLVVWLGMINLNACFLIRLLFRQSKYTLATQLLFFCNKLNTRYLKRY